MLPGFRGYQITATMSALGQKQTCRQVRAMSALPPKADIVDTTGLSGWSKVTAVGHAYAFG